MFDTIVGTFDCISSIFSYAQQLWIMQFVISSFEIGSYFVKHHFRNWNDMYY